MSSPRSQRSQRLRQHASLSGRTDSSAESLAILQINVEGLTIAKLDVLEQIAIKNKATFVLLQETHKENNATLKLPGFTLAGHTKSKHHGLATFLPTTSATQRRTWHRGPRWRNKDVAFLHRAAGMTKRQRQQTKEEEEKLEIKKTFFYV